jgi:hypothetical protein
LEYVELQISVRLKALVEINCRQVTDDPPLTSHNIPKSIPIKVKIAILSKKATTLEAILIQISILIQLGGVAGHLIAPP